MDAIKVAGADYRIMTVTINYWTLGRDDADLFVEWRALLAELVSPRATSRRLAPLPDRLEPRGRVHLSPMAISACRRLLRSRCRSALLHWREQYRWTHVVVL